MGLAAANRAGRWPRATRAIRLPHDYLTERLTGRGVTDRGDASGTGWWSPATGGYVDEILALPDVELAAELLPAVARPDGRGRARSPAGAAEALGLAAGTIVGPGTGDNMGAALGLGLRVGQPALSLGTSGTVFAVSERPTADDERHRGRLRRRVRPVPAARLHAELHARGRPDGGLARGSSATTSRHRARS